MPLEDEGGGLCSNSSSLAKLAAMRRASSQVNPLVAERALRLIVKIEIPERRATSTTVLATPSGYQQRRQK